MFLHIDDSICSNYTEKVNCSEQSLPNWLDLKKFFSILYFAICCISISVHNFDNRFYKEQNTT